MGFTEFELGPINTPSLVHMNHGWKGGNERRSAAVFSLKASVYSSLKKDDVHFVD